MLRVLLLIAVLPTATPPIANAPTTIPAAPAIAPTLTPVTRFVDNEFCPASGGHYYKTEWGLPMTNVWALPAYLGRELLGIPAALVGLLVARRALRLMRRAWTIGEPHCRRCGYCLSNLTSDRCPECGTRLTARTRVIARPVGRRVAFGLMVALPLLVTYPAMHFANLGRVIHPLWPQPLWSLGLGQFIATHLADTPAAKAVVIDGSRIVETDLSGNTVRAFEPLPVRILFSFEQADAGSLVTHIDSYGPESRYIDPAANKESAKAWGVYQWARWDLGTGKLVAHRTFGFDAEAWTDNRQVYLIPSKPSPFAPRELEPPAWRSYDATTGESLPPPAWLAAGPQYACLPNRSPWAFTLDWAGRTIGVYDKATGQRADTLNLGKPPDDADCACSFSLTPDGSLILLKRYGVSPELYDVGTRTLLRSFDRDTFAGTSPDLAYFGVSAKAAINDTCTLEIRALRTDRLIATITGSGPLRRIEVRFSPDRRHVYCRGLNWDNTREWAVYELPAAEADGDR